MSLSGFLSFMISIDRLISCLNNDLHRKFALAQFTEALWRRS